jgi:PAS domain S-box-containing protein
MPFDILELLADSADGVYAVNLSQQIVLWNEGAERLLGWKAEEVLGKLCYEVIAGASDPDADGQRFCQAQCLVIRRARRARVTPSHRLLIATQDGSHRWLNVTHVLIPSRRKEATALVHIFQDVTEDVEARETLERLASTIVGVSAQEQQPSDGREESSPLERLTSREREVLHLLAQGLSTEAIAQRLVISAFTVRNHIQRILAKLGSHTRLEAVAHAFRRRLV